jgi:predicted PurR-regulated permease PerM
MRWRPPNIRQILGDRFRIARSRDGERADERDGERDGERDADRAGDSGAEAGSEREAHSPPARVGTPVPPVVVPRWIQLVLLPLAIVGLWELARAIGSVLLIVIFAGVAALILNPPIKALERRGVPRGFGIPLMYLSLVALIALVGVLLSNPVATQVSHFQKDIPSIVRNANRELGNLQTFLGHHGIHIHIQKQGQTALDTIEKSITKRSGAIISFSSNVLQKLAAISFGLIISLVLSIYFLVYSASIGNLVRRVMPPGDGTREDDYPYRVQRAVLGYVRGQVLFSLLMGASATVALWIFGAVGIFPAGQHYALFFGGFYGLMELIPYVGPFLGALPPVIVALLDHPITALWVTILFVVLQQLEGHLVAPQVFRISLRINPILIILALLIGDQLYGIAGALLALPVSTVLRETVLYLRRHLVLEPWSAAAAGAVGAGAGAGGGGPGGGGPGGGGPGGGGPGGGGPGGGGPAPGNGGLSVADDRCSECDAIPAAGDAFCRACGSPLEPRVRTPG